MTTEPIEATTEAIAIRQSGDIGQALGINEILAQVHLIQDVMKKVMIEGEHYGTVPGCGDKKTLLQPGAQKLTMTFRLAPEYQLQETNLDRGHKEYRVVCTLKSIQSGTFVGQGVGCCSTMESKYRWRGGARKCPQCGKEAIIMGKKFKPTDPEPGWLCWTKKEGCGATWHKDAPEIKNQSIEKVENENPADCYNTVLKMAKKRAFVDATITATAASDIFTQDVGDDEPPEPGNGYTDKNLGASGAAGRGSIPDPKADCTSRGHASPVTHSTTRTDSKPVEQKTEGIFPTATTRQWMIEQLQAGAGGKCRDVATEFLRKADMLLSSEQIEDLQLGWVPSSKKQLSLLEAALNDFADGEEAKKPYARNLPPDETKGKKQYQLKTGNGKPAAVPTVPRDAATGSWRDFPVPFGKNAGKALGKLSDSSLAWWIDNYEVTTEYNGRAKKPETIAKDKRFREALDAAKAELGIEESQNAMD